MLRPILAVFRNEFRAKSALLRVILVLRPFTESIDVIYIGMPAVTPARVMGVTHFALALGNCLLRLEDFLRLTVLRSLFVKSEKNAFRKFRGGICAN